MTRILKVNSANPEIEKIRLAASILREGGIVAFPTETVYGLGADAHNRKTIERLYRIKKRPSRKPLTIHIAELERLKELNVEVNPLAERLMNRFWPGPLTLILNSKGGKRVGVRMPRGAIPRSLIKESGVLIVAPSANISGEPPACDVAAIRKNFDGLIDLIVDGGKCEMGVASTVVDVSSPAAKVVREGAISKEKLNIV